MIDINLWKNEFDGKKILIWGYGKEGRSSYELIHLVCPDQRIDIADQRKQNSVIRETVERECVNTRFFFDDEVDFNSYDLILKSPGIVVNGRVQAEKISGVTQLFLKYYGKQTIGVTGTKGKSTTTSLIAAALSEQYKVHLVGNIGVSAFTCLENLEAGDLVAYELGCHQLEYASYSPHVGVFLNLYEEHLDHYGSLDRYRQAKDHVFSNQSEQDVAILHESLTEEIALRPDAVVIGREIDAIGRELICKGHRLLVEDCRLVGDHNYRNAAVAYYIARELYGVSDEQFLHAMASFEPLHHRIEDLGEYEGVRFVNDSISTIGQSCIMALEALRDVDTVLIGGMDRGIEYDELEEYLSAHSNLKVVFMYGSGKRIYEEMKEKGMDRDGLHYCEDLANAVELGRALTSLHHICLLSPAASSYDHFKNFEERGEIFRRLAFRL